MLKMNPNLVRPARLQPDTHHRHERRLLDHLVMRDGCISLSGDSSPGRMPRVTADWRINGSPLLLQHSADDRDIFPVNAAFPQQAIRELVTVAAFGDQNSSRSVLVQAMNRVDAHLLSSLGEVCGQGVDERPVLLLFGRVHHHACRFVRNQQVIVFVQKLDRHGASALCRGLCLFFCQGRIMLRLSIWLSLHDPDRDLIACFYLTL